MMTDDEVFARALPDDVVEMIAIDAAQRVAARFGDGRFNQYIAAPMLPILRSAIREAAKTHPSVARMSLTEESSC
jgi:hypothetical protein